MSPDPKYEKAFDGALTTLLENAKTASIRQEGDYWRPNHGYVICGDETICHPSFEPGQCLMGTHPTRISTFKIARYIAHANPNTIIKLITRYREAIAERDLARAELHKLKDGK